MAVEGGHIDFMFLAPPPTRPLDPLLGQSVLNLYTLGKMDSILPGLKVSKFFLLIAYNLYLDILLLNTWGMQIYANEGIRSTQGQIENACFSITTISS